MRGRSLWLSGLSVALLCGCQDQKTVVAQQAPPVAVPAPPLTATPTLPTTLPRGLRQMPPIPHRRHMSPCAAPPGPRLAHPPKPLHSPTVPVPPRAVTENVRGCAGVRFGIAPDGKPRDIAVVVDFPPGYGFGEAARKVVADSVWAPVDDKALHYIIIHIDPK